MTTLAQANAQAAQAGTDQKQKLRRAVAISVGSVAGILAVLLVTYWGGSYALSGPTGEVKAPPPVYTAGRVNPIKTVYEDKCDRKIHENVPVTGTPMTINRYPHHCGVRWLVRKGAMKPLGPMVPFGEQRPADASGDTRDGMISQVVATTSAETRIDYQLCPATHRSPGLC